MKRAFLLYGLPALLASVIVTTGYIAIRAQPRVAANAIDRPSADAVSLSPSRITLATPSYLVVAAGSKRELLASLEQLGRLLGGSELNKLNVLLHYKAADGTVKPLTDTDLLWLGECPSTDPHSDCYSKPWETSAELGFVALSRPKLIELLRTLDAGQVALVGYVGDDGDVHALTEADLWRRRP